MGRPVHFDISADDPERAAGFYRTVFGWQVDKWEGPVDYWLITTGPEGTPGIDGGMGRRPAAEGPSTVITIDVADLDAALRAILAAGGSVVHGKHAVPGVGWLAYCADTEGNVFGAMQNDPGAR